MGEKDDHQSIELNIVSIIIGILVARIIWLLMGASGLYVESLIDIDPDNSSKDREDAIDLIPGTLIAISISLVIIIIIIGGYLNA
jgi:hypothetical protein